MCRGHIFRWWLRNTLAPSLSVAESGFLPPETLHVTESFDQLATYVYFLPVPSNYDHQEEILFGNLLIIS